MSPPSSVPGSRFSTSPAWAGTRPRAAAADRLDLGPTRRGPRPGHHEQRRPAAGIVGPRQGEQRVELTRRLRPGDPARAAASRSGRRGDERGDEVPVLGGGPFGSMRCRSGCSDSARREGRAGGANEDVHPRIVRATGRPGLASPMSAHRSLCGYVRDRSWAWGRLPAGRGGWRLPAVRRPPFMSSANPRCAGRPGGARRRPGAPGSGPDCPDSRSGGASGGGGGVPLSAVLPGRFRPGLRGFRMTRRSAVAGQCRPRSRSRRRHPRPFLARLGIDA